MSRRGANAVVLKAAIPYLHPRRFRLTLDCGHVVWRAQNGPYASPPRRVKCEACASPDAETTL